MKENNCLLETEQTLSGLIYFYVTIGNCKRVEIKIARPNSKIYYKLMKQVEEVK